MDFSFGGHRQRGDCNLGTEVVRGFFSVLAIAYRRRRIRSGFLLPVAHAQNHSDWRGLCHLVRRRRCPDRVDCVALLRANAGFPRGHRAIAHCGGSRRPQHIFEDDLSFVSASHSPPSTARAVRKLRLQIPSVLRVPAADCLKG